MRLRHHSITLLSGLILTLLLTLGCDQQTAPTASEREIEAQPVPLQVAAIQREHAFDVDGPGNPSILFADPNMVLPSLTDTSYDIYGVTFLWGQLLSAPNPAAILTDWSGRLSVNGEVIIAPLRPIDFETDQDSLFLTNNPAVSAWASRTRGSDLDGLPFVIFVKRGITYIQEPLLSFETRPFSRDFRLAQLERYAAYFSIPGAGAVAVFSERLKFSPCPEGRLDGEWIKEDIAGLTGSIQGAFYSTNTEPTARFSGTFAAVNTAAANTGVGGVVQGSISGYITDEILGTFHGTWRYTDPRMCPVCGSGRGEFRITYKLNDGTNGGMIGDFGFPANDQQLNLPLRGVWRTDCKNIDDLTTVQ